MKNCHISLTFSPSSPAASLKYLSSNKCNFASIFFLFVNILVILQKKAFWIKHVTKIFVLTYSALLFLAEKWPLPRAL